MCGNENSLATVGFAACVVKATKPLERSKLQSPLVAQANVRFINYQSVTLSILILL